MRRTDLPANAPPILGAALWMAGALASFSVMAVSIRLLSGGMGLFQILFLRSVVGLAVVTVLAWGFRHGWSSVRSRQPRVQVLRNLVHFAGQWCWAAGIAFLPLATVFALEFTTPVFAAILAVLCLGERLNRGRLAMIGFGLIGVLVVVRPGATLFDPVAAIVLLAAFCYASAHALTKRLTRSDPALAVLFWMSAVQLPLGLGPALFDWAPVSWAALPAVLALGLSGLTAHYSVARALALADATVVVPLDFLRLPLIAVVGLLLFGEPLDPFALLGGAVIVVGIWVGIAHEHGRQR